jgi:hypothetical protein
MTSKIKVDNIENQCGSAVVTKCGGTTTINGTTVVASAAVKTNAYQASDGGNIIDQSGSTITLGASGDTIQLAGGASQTGFGREGSVDWQTASIKTATFTAANGEGYFANTSGGAFTLNLPAGTAGNIVAVADYTRTFDSNNLTVTPNGSQKIGGVANSLVLSTVGQSLTFVYVDDTEGWINTSESTGSAGTQPFIVATGGTESTSGDDKIHTFTGPGTFTITSASSTASYNKVGYLVVAGGGGGGANDGGGGAGGGFREGRCGPVTPYTDSPLGTSGILVSAQAYPIVVGAGGPKAPGVAVPGAKGSDSSALGITSTGGGYGASEDTPRNGGPGGSGGGAGAGGGTPGTGGSGNTPPVSPAQGTNGGSGPGAGPAITPADRAGGGAGGATVAGTNGDTSGNGGSGGAGAQTQITGGPVGYAAGGGGGGRSSGGPGSPVGGGGNGSGTSGCSGNGTAGRGSGGGGAGEGGPGTRAGNGGGGIVIIRYKRQ